MKTKAEIQTPNVPNFVKIKIGQQEISLSLAELTDDDLDEICIKWKQALFANKNRQLKNKDLK